MRICRLFSGMTCHRIEKEKKMTKKDIRNFLKKSILSINPPAFAYKDPDFHIYEQFTLKVLYHFFSLQEVEDLLEEAKVR